LRKHVTISIIFILVMAGTALSGSEKSEKKYLEGINRLSASKNKTAAEKLAAEFFKNYPGSRHAPEVRLTLAEMETSPREAVSKYRYVLNKYRHFKKNDYVRYRICEIHYLSSEWKELKAEAQKGKKAFPSGAYGDRFTNFLIFAQMQLGEYDEAERECRRLVENNHEYNRLAGALLVLAQIYKKSSGLSRHYINTIREIATGFSESDAMPSTLFLLGEFYELKKMHDESYSAYSDLTEKYPGSPESAEAGKKIKQLLQLTPKKTAYLPGKKIVDASENIDISPEIDLPAEGESRVFYSLAVGPLDSLKSATEMKKLLNEYDFIKTVRLKSGYAIYVSRCPDEESILRVKIRIAEEYGLNGRIVRISSNGKNYYIYGE
jgi:outer membrane protein assembly factor BamD (BamD/ComL family)